jgi:hypothetical protein
MSGRGVSTLEELGIDPSKLNWEPMPKGDDVFTTSEVAPSKTGPVGALTIAEAKAGLALTFGVRPETIEIMIRG